MSHAKGKKGNTSLGLKLNANPNPRVEQSLREKASNKNEFSSVKHAIDFVGNR
jgi:hypothetical protein